VQGRRLLGGGPGCKSRRPSASPGLGRGWGCWSRSRRGQGAWRQCWSEPAQCSSSEVWFDFDLLLPVLNEMPARTQNSNFQNFPLWVLIILAKVPSHIFVMEKGWVLQEFIFQIWYVQWFRFKLWLKFEWGSNLKFGWMLVGWVSIQLG
jgi:hypothetical protein